MTITDFILAGLLFLLATGISALGIGGFVGWLFDIHFWYTTLVCGFLVAVVFGAFLYFTTHMTVG